jgi:hypothetical protein
MVKQEDLHIKSSALTRYKFTSWTSFRAQFLWFQFNYLGVKFLCKVFLIFGSLFYDAVNIWTL